MIGRRLASGSLVRVLFALFLGLTSHGAQAQNAPVVRLETNMGNIDI